ncbi:RISC-loading complex subunit tarbp2 isoform X2 [Eurytemora carolleeae]|nr:RISC-loading complex subunit tarbp2 isoform X2 [Eurytemora carolleeae]XP_023336914.1 RISC-loading complex subunit tarbp2 isoform X2 [Eurytemora carolleeae]|eukprot:XP_023336906.1 RISC-loading complex subunit tarbp2-like isoform X2 [Eurytemora affinis]
MSNYETNPVGALQERFQSRGITPVYRVVQAAGASHAPTFSFQVILGELTATGAGSSKKQAKHSAARAMLDKLDGRVPAQDGQQPLPPVQDPNFSQAPGNTVGGLQELCVKQGFPMPTYSDGTVDGQPHQRNFSITCTVGKMQENGAGGSKKDAKREAAQKMIDKLKSLGQNRTEQVGGVVDVLSAEDEEMITKISNMKIDLLTPDASEKVAAFYKNLQNANGKFLAKLHVTSLSNRSVNYKTMLEDVSKEQKFEVTYVEVEEKNDDGEHQCLVQISTLPIAVCYAAGKDYDKAQNEAARITLNYLKMMTKRSQRGKK